MVSQSFDGPLFYVVIIIISNLQCFHCWIDSIVEAIHWSVRWRPFVEVLLRLKHLIIVKLMSYVFYYNCWSYFVEMFVEVLLRFKHLIIVKLMSYVFTTNNRPCINLLRFSFGSQGCLLLKVVLIVFVRLLPNIQCTQHWRALVQFLNL